jgi:cephalosporin hydroxylase
MNDLERYFQNNPGNLIHKWLHYFEVYERHFARFRQQPITLVEFGVFHGGSLQMWKHYFGPHARIIGVDINPACSKFAEPQIEIKIGNQEDRTFLQSLAQQVGPIDILIDDGGHTMQQQIATFEVLYPHVQPQGMYLCEDTLTSYRASFGGGYRNPGSFIEYSKQWIDYLHAWHSQEPNQLSVNDFTRSANSVHFYDSVVVIEKQPRQEPRHTKTGKPQF